MRLLTDHKHVQTRVSIHTHISLHAYTKKTTYDSRVGLADADENNTCGSQVKHGREMRVARERERGKVV